MRDPKSYRGWNPEEIRFLSRRYFLTGNLLLYVGSFALWMGVGFMLSAQTWTACAIGGAASAIGGLLVAGAVWRLRKSANAADELEARHQRTIERLIR